MNNVEQAYEAIAHDLIAFPNGRPWDFLTAHYQIVPGMVSVTWTLSYSGVEDDQWAESDVSNGRKARKAARYLKDEVLRTTGHQIWGLSFTLFPTGKFKINYDYNKPDGLG